MLSSTLNAQKKFKFVFLRKFAVFSCDTKNAEQAPVHNLFQSNCPQLHFCPEVNMRQLKVLCLVWFDNVQSYLKHFQGSTFIIC